jgi:L-alanine-DL-glutamate epimerase-like enolase superfamily enzyme
MGADPVAERRRVAAVRDAAGYGARLRLDANGAWSVDQAIRTLGALADHDIELVEQPVASADIEALRQVRAASVIPVAADEAVESLATARSVIAAGAADLLVLKPMRLGGLRPTLAVAALAAEAGVRSIVTTTIDTGIGTAAALQAAASLPAGTPACGLATAALLESDLLATPLPVERGVMTLPAGPGLGVSLSAAALGRYCGPERFEYA